MASIRQAAQNVLDIAKDGIGWIVLYKKGRGWESTYCYPEYDENTCRLDFTELDDQEMTELREIVEIDPMALIVNSYVMNLGDPETMTRDSLAEALKWQYKLNNSELRDALPEKAEDSADPALTYEEFIDLAKQNYSKGGDGYVECWEEYQFNDYVKLFGAITEKKALEMFALDYELERENEEFIRWASGMDTEEETKAGCETVEKPEGDWQVVYVSESGETVEVESGVTKEWAEEFCTSNWGMWPDKNAQADDITGEHLRELIIKPMKGERTMKILICIEHVGKKGWDSKIGSHIQFRGKRRMIQGRLMEDYEKEGDGIFWMMQRSICLKAVYTQADMIEKRLYDEAETLEDGEIVQIWKIIDHGDHIEDGGRGEYKFHALGDYSDCGKFEKIA